MTKVACISDTHNKHKEIEMPEADILVCTGDISSRGYEHELQSFCKWMGEQDYKHKILVCGNHDIGAEKQALLFRQMCEDNGIIYLNDQTVMVEGLKFHGSPVTPRFGHGWAWNRDIKDTRTASEIANYVPSKSIKVHWDMIPEDVDILLTHGPPQGILDWAMYPQAHVGCPELYKKVMEIEPKLHVFGHIHESHGQQKIGETIFVNAAICTLAYKPENLVQVVDVN